MRKVTKKTTRMSSVPAAEEPVVSGEVAPGGQQGTSSGSSASGGGRGRSVTASGAGENMQASGGGGSGSGGGSGGGGRAAPAGRSVRNGSGAGAGGGSSGSGGSSGGSESDTQAPDKGSGGGAAVGSSADEAEKPDTGGAADSSNGSESESADKPDDNKDDKPTDEGDGDHIGADAPDTPDSPGGPDDKSGDKKDSDKDGDKKDDKSDDKKDDKSDDKKDDKSDGKDGSGDDKKDEGSDGSASGAAGRKDEGDEAKGAGETAGGKAAGDEGEAKGAGETAGGNAAADNGESESASQALGNKDAGDGGEPQSAAEAAGGGDAAGGAGGDDAKSAAEAAGGKEAADQVSGDGKPDSGGAGGMPDGKEAAKDAADMAPGGQGAMDAAKNGDLASAGGDAATDSNGYARNAKEYADAAKKGDKEGKEKAAVKAGAKGIGDAVSGGALTAADESTGGAASKAVDKGIDKAYESGLIDKLKKHWKKQIAIWLAMKAAMAAMLAALLRALMQMLQALISAIINMIMQMFAWLIKLIMIVMKIIAVVQAAIIAVAAAIGAVAAAIATTAAVLGGAVAVDYGSFDDYDADPLHDCVAEYDRAYRGLFGSDDANDYGGPGALQVLQQMDEKKESGELPLAQVLDSAQRIRSFFRQYGLTDTQCAAIVGTLYDISKLDYTYVAPVDSGYSDQQFFLTPEDPANGGSAAKHWMEGRDYVLLNMSTNNGDYPGSSTTPWDYFSAHPTYYRTGIGLGAWADVAESEVHGSYAAAHITENPHSRLRSFTEELNDNIMEVDAAVDAARVWQQDMIMERQNRQAVVWGGRNPGDNGQPDELGTANHVIENYSLWKNGSAESDHTTWDNNEYWAQSDPTIDIDWLADGYGYSPNGDWDHLTQKSLAWMYNQRKSELLQKESELNTAIVNLNTAYNDYLTAYGLVNGANNEIFELKNVAFKDVQFQSDLWYVDPENHLTEDIGTLGTVDIRYDLVNYDALSAWVATLDSTSNWTKMTLQYKNGLTRNVLDNAATEDMYFLEAQYAYWVNAYAKRGPYGIQTRPHGDTNLVGDGPSVSDIGVDWNVSSMYGAWSVYPRYDVGYGNDAFNKCTDAWGGENEYTMHSLLSAYARTGIGDNYDGHSVADVYDVNLPKPFTDLSTSTIESKLNDYYVNPQIVFKRNGVGLGGHYGVDFDNVYRDNKILSSDVGMGLTLDDMFTGRSYYYIPTNVGLGSDCGTIVSRLYGGNSTSEFDMYVFNGASWSGGHYYNTFGTTWHTADSRQGYINSTIPLVANETHVNQSSLYSWEVPNRKFTVIPNKFGNSHNISNLNHFIYCHTHDCSWVMNPYDDTRDVKDWGRYTDNVPGWYDNSKHWASDKRDRYSASWDWWGQAYWGSRWSDDDYQVAAANPQDWNWGYTTKFRDNSEQHHTLYHMYGDEDDNKGATWHYNDFKSKASSFVSTQGDVVSQFETNAQNYKTKYDDLLQKIAAVQTAAAAYEEQADLTNAASKYFAQGKLDYYEADEDAYHANAVYVEDAIRDDMGSPEGVWYSEFGKHYILQTGASDSWGNYRVKYYNLWDQFVNNRTEEPEDGQYIHWYDLEAQLLWMISDSEYADDFVEWQSKKNPGLDGITKDFREHVLHTSKGTLGDSQNATYAFYYLFQFGSPYNMNIKYANKESAAYKIVEKWIETRTMHIQELGEVTIGTASAADAIWDPFAMNGYFGSSLLRAAEDGYNHSAVNVLGELKNTCSYIDVIDNSTFAKAALLLLDPNKACRGVSTAAAADLYIYVDGVIMNNNPDWYKSYVESGNNVVYHQYYGDPMRWIVDAMSWSGADNTLLVDNVGKASHTETYAGSSVYNYDPKWTLQDLYDYLRRMTQSEDNGEQNGNQRFYREEDALDGVYTPDNGHVDLEKDDTTFTDPGQREYIYEAHNHGDGEGAEHDHNNDNVKWAEIDIDWGTVTSTNPVTFDGKWQSQLQPGDIIIVEPNVSAGGSGDDLQVAVWFGKSMVRDMYPKLEYKFEDPDNPGTFIDRDKNIYGEFVAGWCNGYYNKPALIQEYDFYTLFALGTNSDSVFPTSGGGGITAFNSKGNARVFRLVNPDHNTKYRNVAWDWMTQMQYDESDYYDD